MMVKDINETAGLGSFPRGLTVIGSTIFFAANDGINGEELSKTPDVAQTCTICHGDVGTKTVVKPKAGQSLKMGTCLDCHRNNGVSTDCTVCHK